MNHTTFSELNKWTKPVSRSVGFYSDSLIYLEVLKFSQKVNFFTKNDLRNLLVNNVRGLIYREFISNTAIDNLVRELNSFGWIKKYLTNDIEHHKEIQKAPDSSESFMITPKGSRLLEKSSVDLHYFYEMVIIEINKIYVIPSWFIQRLWDINPTNQGLVVIPAPLKNWNPESRKWGDNEWKSEFKEQIHISINKVKSILPYSFPINEEIWIEEVKNVWIKIGNAKPRKFDSTTKALSHYSPRKRLAISMKEASINLLFSNINPKSKIEDFDGAKSPLSPRTYSYWCTRLEELGLINYTDYNQYLPGRIIYPVCSFKDRTYGKDFVEILDFKNNYNIPLKIYRPSWEEIRIKFTDVLFQEYQKIFLRTRSLYVSIQELRDEVCRVLKLSSTLFDKFIENAFFESNKGLFKLRISIETDIREDQRNGYQMLRKPVYFNNKVITLIAITKQ